MDYKNGSQLARPGYFLTSAYFEGSQGNSTSASAIYDLAVGDYIEIYIYQNSGDSQSAISTETFFTGYKLIGV